MDMRTAVDAYTTPESPLGQAAQEDLCRWYGLPSFNYGAMSDAKTIDEQSPSSTASRPCPGASDAAR